MKLLAALFLASALGAAGAVAQDDERALRVLCNKQFAETDAQTLTVTNESMRPRTVYARFALVSDPGNRNYGFFQTIPARTELVYHLPVDAEVFACDGKYWDDARPNERWMGKVEAGEKLRFAAAKFRP